MAFPLPLKNEFNISRNKRPPLYSLILIPVSNFTLEVYVPPKPGIPAVTSCAILGRNPLINVKDEL